MACETSPDDVRLSNQKRAAARTRCRQALADHLRSRLGIVVDPDVVRLIPNADDGYIWLRQPQMEHLFAKQLSKHNYGAYMELCREIGVSFEAIPKPALTTEESVWNGDSADGTTSLLSLRSSINQLKIENESLKKELAMCVEKAQAEDVARQRAEDRSSQLENELCTERIKQDLLCQKNVQLTSTVKRLTKRLGHTNSGVKKAMSALYRLSPNAVHVCDEGNRVDQMV